MPTDIELVEMLARRVMCWHKFMPNHHQWLDSGSLHAADVLTWNPLTNAAHSKQVRDKLAEEFDYTLGRATNFAMALWPKGAVDKYSQPKYLAVDDTEFRAVALCALRAKGLVNE